MRYSFVAPLEMVTGTLNLSAIATSLRRRERRRILEKPVNNRRGAISISREDKAFEASSPLHDQKIFYVDRWRESEGDQLADL